MAFRAVFVTQRSGFESVSFRQIGGRQILLDEGLPGGLGLGTSLLTLSLLVTLVGGLSSGTTRAVVLDVLVSLDLLFESDILAHTNLTVDVNLETLIRKFATAKRQN